ncbi:MAG: type II secretion system protein [Anaerohalosphaera sp.]|nr:type II secretion system protein [Anaerohalosphaera sp.]
MKKKGFTLIELLVVIAIIAMLLAILMPALGKVKRLAERLVCGTNLKGMGTAHNTYAFDYDDEFAVQGGKRPVVWSRRTSVWNIPATNFNDGTLGNVELTVGASLYLLVREADVDPKSFVCKGGGQRVYEGECNIVADLVDLWDFGSWSWPTPNTAASTGPENCVSYSYQQPYSLGGFAAHPASGSSTASMAIMADKNPFYDSKLTRNDSPDETNWTGVAGVLAWNTSTLEPVSNPKYKVQVNNSDAHSREGQNVLFGDGHVDWTKRPNVGMEEDNIYTSWYGNPTAPVRSPESYQKGFGPSILGEGVPRSGSDSLLANDDQNGGFN